VKVTKRQLDALHDAAQLAKAQLHEAAAAWTNFRLAHGQIGALSASIPGGAGHELLKARDAAAARYAAAAEKSADARLSMEGRVA
jgi:predicted phage gp36 major capsid-like protein